MSTTAIVAQDRITRINELVADIQAQLVQNVERIIDLGKELLEIKGELDHGQFQPWIESNFRFSYATARRWMSAAENAQNIRKRLKGGTLASLSEAYTAKTAQLMLSDPKATGPKRVKVARAGRGPGEAAIDWAEPTVPLKRYKVLARNGEVHVLTPNGATTLAFKGTAYLDPVVGMEWALRDALTSLDKGLQLLFENYFLALEREEDGEPQPLPGMGPLPGEADPARSSESASSPEGESKPTYRSVLDEDDE